MYKLSCELCSVNRFLKLKCTVIYKDNAGHNKVIKSHFNGNSYLTIKQYPYLTMEIVNDIEKRREQWSHSKVMNLNQFDMFLFMTSASELARAFVEEKNLYRYDQQHNLCINKALANKKSVTIPLSFNRSIWITPIVVRSDDTKVEMEGVALCFDSPANYVSLSYDEFKFLIYYMNKINLDEMSLQLFMFAELTEGKEFKELDNLPGIYNKKEVPAIPDKEPPKDESVTGFIPAISEGSIPKI